ncbi:MAG: ferritin [Flammeovirgaceae bacterium]|nr:ferritin [Flammeovirgaceae bacterium]MBE60737.1 ferritin [Flammeovirgaceae bacterium]HCX20489.1 ferritin [Cytophagales bacterium]|tara:strand:+ start:335 stop:868 length:534 start_codon:yes stop_codon:yes gene_type:complete
MKDILRRHSVLKDEIVDIINKQVKMEAQSSAAYLAMAAWCDKEGYDNCAEFFFKQSDEERKHQLKFFHYLVDMECEAISPAVDQSQHEFDKLRSVFETALEMEIAVTDAIHDIVRLCRKEGDLATEEFLRWFVTEQIEEEYVARRCLELFDVLGEDKIALGMIEERILGVSYDAGEA